MASLRDEIGSGDSSYAEGHGNEGRGTGGHAPGKKALTDRLPARRSKDGDKADDGGELKPARDYILAISQVADDVASNTPRLSLAAGKTDVPGIEFATFTAVNKAGDRYAAAMIAARATVTVVSIPGTDGRRFTDSKDAHVIAHLPALRVYEEADGTKTAVPANRAPRKAQEPFGYLDELRGGGGGGQAGGARPAASRGQKVPARQIEVPFSVMSAGMFNIGGTQIGLAAGLSQLASSGAAVPPAMVRERARAHMVVRGERHPLEVLSIATAHTLARSPDLQPDELNSAGAHAKAFLFLPELELDVHADGSLGADGSVGGGGDGLEM